MFDFPPEFLEFLQQLSLQQRGQAPGNQFNIQDPTQPDFATPGFNPNGGNPNLRIPPVDASLEGSPVSTVLNPNQSGTLDSTVTPQVNPGVGSGVSNNSGERTVGPNISLSNLGPRFSNIDDLLASTNPELAPDNLVPNTGTAETSTENQLRGTSNQAFINSLTAIASGTDLTNSVFSLGQSLAFDPSNFGESPEARRRARRGNTTRLVGSIGSTLLDLARVGFAGAGFQNRLQSTLDRQARVTRQGLVGNFQTVKHGGKIKVLQDGGTTGPEEPAISIEELLTGEFITGIPSFSKELPSARTEIEVNEYIMNPDGTVQLVKGDTHNEGGERVILEDGTKVVSNHLQIGDENAAYFKDKYGIKVSPKNTYAKVIEMYTEKIGLKELNDNQIEMFQKLKEQESVDHEMTSSLNHQFISGKINEIENEKTPLERNRTILFEDVFQRQEDSKNMKEVDSVQEEFRSGGTVGSKSLISKLAKRNGISMEEATALVEEFRAGGRKKKKPYQDGGETGPGDGTDPRNPFIRRRNRFNDSSTFVSQSATNVGFGNVTEENFLDRIQNLRVGFPLIVDKTFDIQVDDQGNITSAELKPGRSIENFQREVDNNYQLLIDDVANRIDDPSQRQNFIDQVNNERFNNQVARGFDNKFGNFTSSRPNFGFELLTPNDFQKIQDQGLTTFQQLLDDDGNIDSTLDLSNTSINNLNRFRGTSANFLLGEIPGTSPSPGPDPQPDNTGDPITISAGANNLGSIASFPFLPDQSVVPPDSLDPQLRVNRRFDRIDPVEISPDQALSEIFAQEDAAITQINDLPGSQRIAALTNLSANTQRAANTAVTQTNIANAQNQFNADQINLQQSNLEENARAQDLLDFERRQLTGKAITLENLNNFFDFNRRVRLGNFNTIQRFNTLNSLFENFDIGSFGTIDRNNAGTTFFNPRGTAETIDPIEYNELNIITNRQPQ